MSYSPENPKRKVSEPAQTLEEIETKLTFEIIITQSRGGGYNVSLIPTGNNKAIDFCISTSISRKEIIEKLFESISEVVHDDKQIEQIAEEILKILQPT